MRKATLNRLHRRSSHFTTCPARSQAYAHSIADATLKLRLRIATGSTIGCKFTAGCTKGGIVQTGCYVFARSGSSRASVRCSVAAASAIVSAWGLSIFTARRYASAVLAVVVCLCVRLSVRPSVCPSQAGIVSKRLQIGSRKQRRTIAQELWFSDAKNLRNSNGVTPNGSTKWRWGRVK